jgi:hypothetical protein
MVAAPTLKLIFVSLRPDIFKFALARVLRDAVIDTAKNELLVVH